MEEMKVNVDIEFYVDDKPLSTRKSELTAEDVLVLAGIPTDQFYLVAPDGTEYKDSEEIVKIQSGDHFKTRKREREGPTPGSKTIHYKVNGEEQTTEQDSLTMEEILRNAGSEASIDTSQIENYFLENIIDGRKYENLSDVVKIKEDDQFLAVHVGRTPVA